MYNYQILALVLHVYTQAMDTQRETLTRYRKKHGEASESMSSLRDARESEVSERIHVHMLKLAEQRKQAGIISTPSSELLQAEKKLAEVCPFYMHLY